MGLQQKRIPHMAVTHPLDASPRLMVAAALASAVITANKSPPEGYGLQCQYRGEDVQRGFSGARRAYLMPQRGPTLNYLPAMSSLSSRTRSAPAGFIEPCLPSPADKPPSGSNWIHEIKHDGYRLMARRDPVGIRLLTRNGHDWAARYPLIVEAVNHLKVRSVLIDGVVVCCALTTTAWPYHCRITYSLVEPSACPFRPRRH
jgi:ATP dependent DNA ligase domain